MANVIPEEVSRFSDPNDFSTQVREFVKLKATMDILEARQKELREKLFEQLDLNGEEDRLMKDLRLAGRSSTDMCQTSLNYPFLQRRVGKPGPSLTWQQG